jgi:hypothetical protein
MPNHPTHKLLLIQFVLWIVLGLSLNACTTGSAASAPLTGSDAAALQGSQLNPEGTHAVVKTPSAPVLVILNPTDNSVVNTEEVTIVGQADAGSVVSANDEMAIAKQDRSFSVKIKLDEGLNVIEISASDPQGNQTTVYLTITYDPQS